MTSLQEAEDITAGPRPRYRESQVLTLADLVDEQAARIQGVRRHLLTQHGWGVTGGLQLTSSATGIRVDSGDAVDRFGRCLRVGEPWVLRWGDLDPAAEAFDVWLCCTEIYRFARILERTVVVWTAADPDRDRPAASGPVYLGRVFRQGASAHEPPPVADATLIGQSILAAGGGQVTLGPDDKDPAVGVTVSGRQRLTVRHGGSRLAADTTVSRSVTVSGPDPKVSWSTPVSEPDRPRPWAVYRHRTPSQPGDAATPGRPELNDLRVEMPASDGSSSSASIVVGPEPDPAADPPMAVSADGSVRMRTLRPGRVLVAAARADIADPRYRQAIEDAWIDEIVRISDRIYQRFGPEPTAAPLQAETADFPAGQPVVGGTVTPRAIIRNAGTADVNQIRVVRSIKLAGAAAGAPEPVATISVLAGGQTRTIGQPSYSIPEGIAGETLILTLSAVGLRPSGDIAWSVQTRSWSVVDRPGPGQ